MATRFDLEHDIMGAWKIIDDIKLLTEAISERPIPMSEDELTNYLLGLECIYQLRFEKLFKTFGVMVRNGEFE